MRDYYESLTPGPGNVVLLDLTTDFTSKKSGSCTNLVKSWPGPLKLFATTDY